MTPMHTTPLIDAVFVGGPKTMVDQIGPWTSSIRRERAHGAVEVSMQGIVGDKATQPYHGSPNAALCVHLADHYSFWKQVHGMDLQPGAVGENLTLSGIAEEAIYVGDIIRIGTVVAQVTGPRVPCANQARHIGRTNWVRLTVRENRTGFYMRLLQPGILQAGDAWELEQRLNQDASIPSINRCMYLQFDPVYANRIIGMSGIGEWWAQQAAERLAARDKHWTAIMQDTNSSDLTSPRS